MRLGILIIIAAFACPSVAQANPRTYDLPASYQYDAGIRYHCNKVDGYRSTEHLFTYMGILTLGAGVLLAATQPSPTHTYGKKPSYIAPGMLMGLGVVELMFGRSSAKKRKEAESECLRLIGKEKEA